MLSRHRLVPVLALAVVLALGACDGATVSPSPSASPTASPSATQRPSATPNVSAEPSGSPDAAANEAIYAAIEEAVVGLRELEPNADVDPQLMSEEELQEETERSFTEDNPPELIRANEVLLRSLGMLEQDASLTDLYVELLGSQVAGYYDPEVDELFVIARSGGLGVAERVTYAHEFTHALQDQHFDLESFELDTIGQGDRSLGRLSLIEGDATAVMSFWAQTALTPEEAIELLQTSLDPEQTAILQRMPPILRESLEFPYNGGLALVLALQARGGWEAVNESYDDPPASTEQVLHPDKYFAREAPISVDLPDDLAARMGDGWEVTLEDTFGEFQTQVWLRNALRRVQPGNEAAAGWGGDRLAVLEGANDGWALVWRTEWDSAAEADQFETAASEALSAAQGEARLLPGEGGSVRWIVIGSDAETLGTAANAAGLAG